MVTKLFLTEKFIIFLTILKNFGLKMTVEHIKLIIKSDQEPSTKGLIKVIKRERPESIEEMVPEESEVGEHQSNGMVERAIQTITRQAKAMKMGIQQR